MIGHHITEHARQKILKEIAIRAQKHVLDMTYNWCDLSRRPSTLIKLTLLTGASKYQSFRRSARTLIASSLDSGTPKLTRGRFFSRPRLSPRPGKPWKCSLSLSSVRRISLHWSIRCSRSVAHRPATSIRKASVGLGLPRPHHRYPAFPCLSAQRPFPLEMQALS